MSQVSKFINLMIEYGQKIQSCIHKKYKSFVRSALNLQNLAKNVNSNGRVFLTNQIIVFKLGLESKSQKCVEISLLYLHKLFTLNFIDLNAPNFAENYSIQQDGVKQVVVPKYNKEIRHQLVRLLQPLVHFKSNDINQLLLKNYEHLISQPIIQPLLEVCYSSQNESAYIVINAYLNQRIYLYESLKLYTQDELELANTSLPKNEKLSLELKKANEKNDKFKMFIGMYMEEFLSRQLLKTGGKYGWCIICKQPAQHYCKNTKASVCSIDCKKKHLDIAQSQHHEYFQSQGLEKQLIQQLKLILECLYKKQNAMVLSAMVNITENPSLFMIVSTKFKNIFQAYVPKLLSRLYQSKSELITSNMYLLMGNMIKYWPVQCFSEIGYFLKNNVIKVLQDKKPKFNSLMLVFKTISKMIENGKNLLQVYINFDCEINQENVIQKIMFEIARMCQDKYAQVPFYTKQEKILIKNSCITIYQMMAKSLNLYTQAYPSKRNIQPTLLNKQRKTSIQKFMIKFNQHWSSGLKALFNMNLVGLDSNQEIIQIIFQTKGLNKEQVDQMLFCQAGYNYLNIFKKRISTNKGLLRKLLEYYRYLPLKRSSISEKVFMDTFKEEGISQMVDRYLTTIQKMESYEHFKKMIEIENISENECQTLYILALQCNSNLTMGSHQHYYTHCCSRSYIQAMTSQLSLLQIPLSYLLQTYYDLDRILLLLSDLVQICQTSNWISLLIKNPSIDTLDYTHSVESIKIIKWVLDIVMNHPEHLNDWTSILGFIRNIHSIVMVGSGKKEQISVQMIEKCLMKASATIDQGFPQFINNVLSIAKEDLKEEKPFMIQKYFQMLELNSQKYANNFQFIFKQLNNLVVQIPDTYTENLIYMSDMVKGSLIKLLKSNARQTIQVSYFELLEVLSHKNNKEVGDFVMNCLTMVIMHHYNIRIGSWKIIFELMGKHAIAHRHQVHIITQKIIAEELKGCQAMGENLLRICFKLVDPNEDKYSVEVIHSIIKIINFILNQSHCPSPKQVLKTTILQVTKFVRYSCHESAIKMVFMLLELQQSSGDIYFGKDQLYAIFKEMYEYIQQLPDEILSRGEKIMNQSLYWSVNRRNYQIIINLEASIIGHGKKLAHTAAKCLKTYIQMTNPKEKEEWRVIEGTLVRIINDTRISNHLTNLQQISIQAFTQKLIIQKLAVELLPNDGDCLEILKSIYQESIDFNDNIDLRNKLWEKGLNNKSEYLPNILNLEEVISNRIMAIFNSTHNFKEMFLFTITILERYRESATTLKTLIASPNPNKPQTQYLYIRIIPLTKIATYILPKIEKICSTIEEKQIIVQKLISILPFVEQREPYLKAIRQTIKK